MYVPLCFARLICGRYRYSDRRSLRDDSSRSLVGGTADAMARSVLVRQSSSRAALFHRLSSTSITLELSNFDFQLRRQRVCPPTFSFRSWSPALSSSSSCFESFQDNQAINMIMGDDLRLRPEAVGRSQQVRDCFLRNVAS